MPPIENDIISRVDARGYRITVCQFKGQIFLTLYRLTNGSPFLCQGWNIEKNPHLNSLYHFQSRQWNTGEVNNFLKCYEETEGVEP